MSIESKSSFEDSARFVMKVKDEYQQALQTPFKSLDSHDFDKDVKRIKRFEKAFKAHASSPLFLEASKVSQNITATRKFLHTAVKVDPEFVPQKTRDVGLEILSGKPNRFESVQVVERLGEGAVGKVDKVDALGQTYALKTLLDSSFQSELNEEYSQLLTLKHPRIVDVAYIDEGKLYLEFVDGGTLQSNLKHLTPEETRKVFCQIAEGLSYIHQVGNIHNDIKVDNILLTKKKDVKIADLGLARPIGKVEEGESWVGSNYNFPPELYLGEVNLGNAQKIDVWSFGILIWEVLKKDSGVKDPYKSLDGTTTTWGANGFNAKLLEEHLDPNKRKSIDPTGYLQKLMMSCLQKDPAKRPTMYDINEKLPGEKEFDVMQYSRKEKRGDFDDVFDAKRIC